MEQIDIPAAAVVIRLSRPARGWRVLVLLTVAALFVAGTATGQDDWWPFGPWRMFSTSTPPSGSVVSLAIQIRAGSDPTWRAAALNPDSVGLNRAEVEGRIPQLTADPAMLATLARSHSRLKPKEPRWSAVRVVRNEVLLTDGAPNGRLRTSILASWPPS